MQQFAGTSAGTVYYKNCTAARNAGAAPVRIGDPGYAPHLDRDGDGIGCE
ncbi:TPA: excalibur calcium-binding domain-containing protein [Streptococcus suis]|nr:excalibur calcium-binding domain-containing protein [Streptococcus suis]